MMYLLPRQPIRRSCTAWRSSMRLFRGGAATPRLPEALRICPRTPRITSVSLRSSWGFLVRPHTCTHHIRALRPESARTLTTCFCFLSQVDRSGEVSGVHDPAVLEGREIKQAKRTLVPSHTHTLTHRNLFLKLYHLCRTLRIGPTSLFARSMG